MTRVFYPEAGFKYSQYQRQSLHLMYSASFKQGPRIITAGTSHVHRNRKKNYFLNTLGILPQGTTKYLRKFASFPPRKYPACKKEKTIN